MKYTKFNNYSNTYVFDSGIKGESIAIFGGIHGNEISGIKVVDELVDKLSNGDIVLLKGKLILAYGNEQAIKKGDKLYKYNLNRLFKEEYLNKESDEYEIKRAKELSKIMINSDLLLDIHSVSSDSEAFIFSENIKSEINLAKRIYNGKIIVGRGDISGDLISGDTDSYMHSLGKVSFTLECGNHNCNNAFNVGYNTTLKLLQEYGLIRGQTEKITEANQVMEMYKIEKTKYGDFTFKKGIKNFDYIKKGDFIGFDGGKEIMAKEDFILLLPNYEKTKLGEEIFYYGRIFK